MFVIGATLFALLLGVAYCILATRRYQASTYMVINPEGSNAMDLGDLTARLGGGGLGFDERVATQIRVIQSQSLAWTVIKDLRLDKAPSFAGHRKYGLFGPLVLDKVPEDIESVNPGRHNSLISAFQNSLKVDVVPHTQEIQVSFLSSDPAVAREVVNHLTAAYQQRVFTTRFDDTLKASDWLSERLADLKRSIEDSQAKLATFEKQTGIIGTDENDNLVLSRLDALSKEVTDAEADRIVKEAEYRVAQTGDPDKIATIAPNTLVTSLRLQQEQLKAQLASLNQEFGAKYPKVLQLEDQLKQTNQSLSAEILNTQEHFRSQYEISAGAEAKIDKAFEDQKQKAYALSAGLDQYGIMKREVQAGSDLYEDLQKRIKEAGVIASLSAPTVDVIDVANLPTSPVSPKTSVVILLSLIGGLGLGGGLALAADALDNVVRNTDEMEALAGIPLWGYIPNLRDRSKKKLEATKTDPHSLVVQTRPKSYPSEAFRAVRTSILLASAGAPPKTILISSSVPAEGKTTISTNIAAALAQSGTQVLLVDADLRNGRLNSRIGVPSSEGLSSSLAGVRSWRDFVEPVPDCPNLFCLPAGTPPPNSAELLGSEHMREQINEWKQEYGHVVIDSPPCLLVTDAVLLARWMDAVLLVTRVGTTPRRGLQHAVRLLLQSVETHSFGLIINDVSGSSGAYGYGYGYGHGSGAYPGYFSETEK
jgi:capsular exopolysaccharide synthesis family protein